MVHDQPLNIWVCHSFCCLQIILIVVIHVQGIKNLQDVGWPPQRPSTNNSKKEWEWCTEALVAQSSRLHWNLSEHFTVSAIADKNPIVALFLFQNWPTRDPFWFLYVVCTGGLWWWPADTVKSQWTFCVLSILFPDRDLLECLVKVQVIVIYYNKLFWKNGRVVGW